MQININPYELFLPVYHEFLLKMKKMLRILHCSRGSGKSRNIALKLNWRCLSETNHRVVIIRDQFVKHSQTTVPEIEGALKMFNPYQRFQFLQAVSVMKFIKHRKKILLSFVNSEFIFLSIDDPEKLK